MHISEAQILAGLAHNPIYMVITLAGYSPPPLPTSHHFVPPGLLVSDRSTTIPTTSVVVDPIVVEVVPQYAAYTPTYLSIIYNDAEDLLPSTRDHVTVLQCLGVRKTMNQELGTPEQGQFVYGKESNEATGQAYLSNLTCYVRIKTTRSRSFLFLFLPHKEKINKRTTCIWEFLSLKDVGWGPPDVHKSAAHVPKLLGQVSLIRVQICLGVTLFFLCVCTMSRFGRLLYKAMIRSIVRQVIFL